MNNGLIQSLLLFKKGFHSLVNSHCQQFNLAGAELFVMGMLFKDGPSHQIQIARKLECDKSHVHRLLEKLDKKGFILFIYNDEGRDRKVALTKEGEKIAKSFDEIIESVKETIFEGVTQDELNVTSKTIQKFANNILNFKKENKDV